MAFSEIDCGLITVHPGVPEIKAHVWVTNAYMTNWERNEYTVMYRMNLAALKSPQYFGYYLKVFAGSTTTAGFIVINKPRGVSTWGGLDYAGCTGFANAEVVDSDGYARFKITIDSDCECHPQSFTVGVGATFKLMNAKPEAPYCTASGAALAGSYASCTWTGSGLEYRTRNSQFGTWSEWKTSSSNSSSGYKNGSVYVPSDLSVSGVQFRSYNYDSTCATKYAYTESEIIKVALPQPSAPTVTTPITLGGSSTASKPSYSVSGASMTFQWYDPSGNEVSTNASYKPPKSGYYCKVLASKDGFVPFYSPASEKVEVVCPNPTNLSQSPDPVMFGSSVTLRYSINSQCTAEIQFYNGSSWVSSNGTNTVNNKTNQFCIRAKKSGCTSSSWVYLDLNIRLKPPTVTVSPMTVYSGDKVNLGFSGTYPPGTSAVFVYRYAGGGEVPTTSPFTIIKPRCQFRCYVECEGYTWSDWSAWSPEVAVKLRAPSVTVTPSTITVKETLTLSASYPESGVNPTYHFQKDIGGKQSSCSTSVTAEKSIKFRAYASKSGYTSSDWSSWATPTVRTNPVNMKTKGFNVEFSPNAFDSVTPEMSFKATWGSFSPSYALGRFDYYWYGLYYMNGSKKTLYTSKEGSNNPLSPGSSQLIVIPPSLVGKTCWLELWPTYSGDKQYDSASHFESPKFEVSAFPNLPDLIYPGTVSTTSCNKSPRLVFKVKNPDYIENEPTSSHGIEDIRIVEARDDGTFTFTFKKNKDKFKPVSGEFGNVVPSSSYVTYVPDPYEGSRTFRIYCSNHYLETKNPVSTTVKYTPFDYVQKGTKVVLSQVEKIDKVVQDAFDSYEKLLGESITIDSRGSEYLEKSPAVSTVNKLNQVYKKVLTYSPRPSGTIDIDSIDVTTSNLPVSADSSTFSNVPGNYFNDVLYILKNML